MSEPISLRAERLNRGLTINEAAEQMDVDRQALMRAEAGKAVPTPANAFKIATFYGHKVTDVWPLEEAAA